MITVAILRMAGLTAEQIVRVVEIAEREQHKIDLEQAAERREKERIRKQIQRSSPKSPMGQRGTRGTPRDKLDPPQMSPPIPPPITTPPEDSGAKAPATHAELERDYFTRGKQVLGKNSGGMLASLLRAKQQDIALARSTLELAASKADPREFVAAACRAPPYVNGQARALTPFQQREQAQRDAVKKLDDYIERCEGREDPGGLLPGIVSGRS